MVGDLVSLSDRDNIETNVPWLYWPEGKDRGLSPSFILDYLQRGMLRPGMLELLAHLRMVGATCVCARARACVRVCVCVCLCLSGSVSVCQCLSVCLSVWPEFFFIRHR